MGYIPCVGTGKRPFRLPPRMICGEDWPWAPDIFGGVQPSMMFFENKPVGIYIIILYIYIYHYITPTSYDFRRCPEIGHPQDSNKKAGTLGMNIQHQVKFSNCQGIFVEDFT
jgi:hypothetical protein